MLFPWIKRADLIAVPQEAGGWVVKDPLTLHYSFLDDNEYAVLNLLDGKHTVDFVLQQLQKLSPEHPFRPDELEQFIRELSAQQLIRQTSGSMPRPQLGASAAQRGSVHSGGRVLRLLLSLLRVQIPLLNPSGLLDRLLPWVRWLQDRWVLQVIIAVMLLAGLVLSLQFAELNRQLPDMQQFLSAQNLILLLIIFVVVKILHEAGHALTARHFGAECNECGIMLMLMTPVLYTNVSDAWMLSRHQRMVITAAGILVELFIAAVCLLLWSIAEPGATRALLLNTMLLCSVNTLLFNGNPLLKFDGYFLLADFLRIPNLASRSAAAVQQFFVTHITGLTSVHTEISRTHAILVTYGMLAAAYRVLLTIAIVHVVGQLAQEWNQRVIGQLLTYAIGCGFLLLPAVRFLSAVLTAVFNHVHEPADVDATELMKANSAVNDTASTRGDPHDATKPPSSDQHSNSNTRPLVGLRLLTAAGLLAAVLLWPLPRSIVVPAFVQPASAALYATLPGQLKATANYGDSVSRGAPVVTLSNSELELQQQRLEAHTRSVQSQLQLLLRNPVTANSELIPGLRESLKAAEQQLHAYRSEAQQLVLHSPSDGIFLPPPALPPPRDPDLPEFWQGTPARAQNLGAWIPRGTLLGYIGQPTDVVLLGCVDEDDIDLLQVGQTATFLNSGGAASPQSATVTEVSTMEARLLPGQLGVEGLVSGQITDAGVVPARPMWLATVQLAPTSDSAAVPLYGTGHIRIEVAAASMIERIYRYLRQAF